MISGFGCDVYFLFLRFVCNYINEAPTYLGRYIFVPEPELGS